MWRSTSALLLALGLLCAEAQAQTVVTTTDRIRATGSNNLTISPLGDVVFDAGGKDLYPATTMDQNLGLIGNRFLSLWAGELNVGVLTVRNTIGTVGGRVLVGPTNELTYDVAGTTTDTWMWVKYNNWYKDDISYFEGFVGASPAVEFIKIVGVTISAINQGNKQFSFVWGANACSSTLFYATAKFAIRGSTANDGLYTVSSCSYSNPTTTVTVSESIPSSLVDGYWIYFDDTAGDGPYGAAYKGYRHFVNRDRESSGIGHAWKAGDAIFDTGRAPISTTSYADTVIQDAPSYFFRLNEAAGPAMYDFSGYARNGTFGGTYTLNNSGAAAGTQTSLGVSGAGYAYRGSETANQITGDLTLEMWIYQNSRSVRQTLTSKKYNCAWELTIETTGALNYYDGDGNTYETLTLVAAGNTIPTGAWTHLVVARDATAKTVTAYVNSNAQTPQSYTKTINGGTDEMVLGAGAPCCAQYFNGYIDEFAVYASRLSPTRITAHYDARNSPTTASVISGFLDAYADHGVKSGTEYGPTLVANLRNSGTYNDWNARVALGNLNGLFNYATNTFGFATGLATSTYVTMDAENGFRACAGGSCAVPRLWLKADGSGHVGNGSLAWNTSGVLNASGWKIDTAAITKDTGSNGTSSGMAPYDYPFYAGATYANRASAPFRVSPSGALTATNASISGTITADSFTSGPLSMTSNGLYISGASSFRSVEFQNGPGGMSMAGDGTLNVYSGGSINLIPDGNGMYGVTASSLGLSAPAYYVSSTPGVDCTSAGTVTTHKGIVTACSSPSPDLVSLRSEVTALRAEIESLKSALAALLARTGGHQ